MIISEMHTAFKLQLDKTNSLETPSFESEEIDYWLNQGIRKFVKTWYSGLNVKQQSFEQSQKRIADLKSLVVEDTISGVKLTVGTIKPNSFIANISELEDLWFILGEEVDITYTKLGASSSTNKRCGVTNTTVDKYPSDVINPYSEHRLHYEEAKPLRLVYQNTIELITDSNYTITKYYIRFLKRPIQVNNTTTTGVVSGNIEPKLKYQAKTASVTYNGVVYTADSYFYGTDNVTTWSGVGATVNLVKSDCDLPEHTHDEIVNVAVDMALENIEQPRYKTHSNETNTME